VYEFTQGRPEDASVTIACSARIAYAARIHSCDRHQTQVTHPIGHDVDTELLLQVEEAANTWWGIVIFDRYVSLLGKSATQMKLRPPW
jgi:hypothetical protein